MIFDHLDRANITPRNYSYSGVFRIFFQNRTLVAFLSHNHILKTSEIQIHGHLRKGSDYVQKIKISWQKMLKMNQYMTV